MTLPRPFTVRALVSLIAGGYALALLCFVLLRLLLGGVLWWVAFFNNVMPVYFILVLGLLPITLIFRAKRGFLLTLPMALLGLLWFGRYYLPPTKVALPSDLTLRVVSFNVWGDNPNLQPIETWLAQQDADVAVTLELPPQWTYGIPALAKTYPNQITHRDWSRYWGSTLLTAHRVIETEHFALVSGGIPQQRMVIDVEGHPIAIYGIHLDLPLGSKNVPFFINNLYAEMFFHYNEAMRNAEIGNLILRLQHEPLPYIVAGDFNMSDQSPIYNDLAATVGDSFRESGVGLGTSWPMLNATVALPVLVPPLMRIDYIWHSPQFHTIETAQGPFLGSDHLPLYAELELQP